MKLKVKAFTVFYNQFCHWQLICPVRVYSIHWKLLKLFHSIWDDKALDKRAAI